MSAEGREARAEAEAGVEADDGMDLLGDDVDMGGLDNQEELNVELENQDWVMVDENTIKSPDRPQEGAQNETDTLPSTIEPATSEMPPAPLAPTEEVTPLSDEEPVAAEEPVIDQQVAAVQDSDIQQSTIDAGDLGLGDDFDSVGNTAGDALAQYGEDNDLDLDTMDDSAFGDAFHPHDD